MLHVKRAAIFISELYLLCDLCSNRLEYGYESNVMWVRIDLRVEPINNNNNNNNNNLIFIMYILRNTHQKAMS